MANWVVSWLSARIALQEDEVAAYGPAALIQKLSQRIPRLIALPLPPAAARADTPAAPPYSGLGRGALGAFVALRCLPHDDAHALNSWRRLLRPGGRVVVVDRLPSRLGQVIARRLEPRRARLHPEEASAIMLNCGFAYIEQSFSGRCVLTSGQRHYDELDAVATTSVADERLS